MNSRRFRDALDESFREELAGALMDRFGFSIPCPDMRLQDIGLPGSKFSGQGYTDEQCRFIEGFAQGFFRSYLAGVRLAASVRALAPPGTVGEGAGARG
jgi:hypothetical protein